MPLRASCPACGEVDVTPQDITVVECVNAPHLSSRVLYCPECEVPSQRPLSRLMAETLRRLGTPVRLFKVPAEVLEEHDGPAISEDDVIDLHVALSLPPADIMRALDSAIRAAGERAA